MSNSSDKGTEGSKPNSTHIYPPKADENVTKEHKGSSNHFEGPPKRMLTIPSTIAVQSEKQATQPEQQAAQQKRQRVLREQPHGDLILLGASQSEIDFIAALEAGEIEGDTPLVDEAEINLRKRRKSWLEERKGRKSWLEETL